MNKSLLNIYINEFSSICKLIGQANLSSVRNGIDHMRDEKNFPPIDTMIACASRLKQASEIACKKRYFPNILWLSEYRINRDGYVEYKLVDSTNETIIIQGPSMFKGTGAPTINRPCLISPVRLSEYPNSNLVFRYEQTNEYNSYWDGYPRRISKNLSE
jgi:hypothetical protein